MRAGEVLDKYQDLKKEHTVLKFQLSRFKGITPDDIIESMTFSHADGERVQTSGVSDKTGKSAGNVPKTEIFGPFPKILGGDRPM